MGETMKKCHNALDKSKPYLGMISLQFGYAGLNILTKVSLNRGMSHYVLVVYRHAFATAVIAPFALILERKARPRITFLISMQIFMLGLLGPVIDQNLYYAGLKLTSPTFSCAMSNMLPAMTFVMAVIFRMEKLEIKKIRCQAKVVGTVVTVAGSMLMTLYKGPAIHMTWTNSHKNVYNSNNTTTSTTHDWFKGSIILIIATFSWASFFILQAVALRVYKDHQLTLTTMVCLIGTLQSTGVTFVMEHHTNPSPWTIGWDLNLLSAAYAGIVSSSISYYVQGLVMKKKGPVFVTSFSPLMMIIVAILGSFILAENFFLGGIIGSILIVGGLYLVLWGKHKEILIKQEVPNHHHHHHHQIEEGTKDKIIIAQSNNKNDHNSSMSIDFAASKDSMQLP